MTKYYFVQSNQIVEGPRKLPKSWRHVSGLDLATAEELAALGWLPEELTGYDPIDSDTQVRTGPTVDIQATKVVVTWGIADKTLADIRALRSAQANTEADRRLSAQFTDLDRIWGGLKAILALKNGQQVPAPVVAALEWVDTLRTQREVLKTAIAGMTKAHLKSLDVTDNSHWS